MPLSLVTARVHLAKTEVAPTSRTALLTGITHPTHTEREREHGTCRSWVTSHANNTDMTTRQPQKNHPRLPVPTADAHTARESVALACRSLQTPQGAGIQEDRPLWGAHPTAFHRSASDFHAGAWLSPHPKPCRLNPFVSARAGVAMPRLQGEAHRAARDSSPVPTPVSKVARGGNPRDSDSAEDGLQHLRSGHDVGIVCTVGLACRRQLLERGK